MVTHKETFIKSERLCSKKAIEALFENGRSFYCHPFLIVWAYSDSDIPFPAQAAFSVPKRGFKLAVNRNLIKRRTREAYRKNKAFLYDFLASSDKKIVFTMIFRKKSIPDYNTIENSVKEMIKMFSGILGESKPKC
ncbi:MAG: ribonuclease P protein component [Odoribacter sp.]|nr:ribonuclease P protein component [Odoribacter sp.]